MFFIILLFPTLVLTSSSSMGFLSKFTTNFAPQEIDVDLYFK